MVIGQFNPSEWHGYLDSPDLANAIMDRLLQRAHPVGVLFGLMPAAN